MKKTIIILTGLILVSTIFAQPRARRNQQNDCRPDKMMMDRGERGKDREAMMVYKLTDKLELTSEQAEKFFPRFREHREEMKSMGEEMREVQKDIREKLKDDKKISDSELSKALNKVNALHTKKDQARFAFINSLDDILDNNQIAKLATTPRDLKKQRQMNKGHRPQWRQ